MQAEKLSKQSSKISAKNNKYFTQSQFASLPVPSNNGQPKMNNTSEQRENQNIREVSPKPDYKLHAHIQSTSYPDLEQYRQNNRNKIVYRTIRQKQRKQSQFNELQKSKSRQKNDKNTPDMKKNNKYIKVQQGDTTDDNIDLSNITRQFSTKTVPAKQKQRNQTQEQLKEMKRYLYTAQKAQLNTTMTPPIKLRQLPRQNMRNLREYNSIKVQSSRSRQRQQFVNNTKTNSKERNYQIISKTLEQTIDENIELKMENEQMKEMYKEALKTVSHLQQIIEDNYANNLKAKNVKYNKYEMKQIYSFLYPYENFNKIIKPSLQAQLKMYRDREEEFKINMRKNIKDLQDELEKVRIREEEYRSIYEFFKKENSNLHQEIRTLRDEITNKYTLQSSQIQKEKIKEVRKQQNAQQYKQKKPNLNPVTQTVNKQIVEELNETQKKKIGLLSSRIESKSLKKQELQAALANYQREVVFPQLAEAQQKILHMDQRCKQLEKAIQNLLYQRREKKEKEKEKQSQRKRIFTLQADQSRASEGSQILQQSRVYNKLIKQKSGGKVIGKLVKVIQQIPQSVASPQVITENKNLKQANEKLQQKIKQKEEKIQEQIKKITELEVKIAIAQQQFREKIRQMDIRQIKQLQMVQKQLKKLRGILENCNMQNFKHLYNQFAQNLEQKKHLTIRLAELEYYYENKHTKVWELQKQLNEAKKKKKQLVEKCINLQNYIQKNINHGRSSDSLVIQGIFDNYFKENQRDEGHLKCVCQMDKIKTYDESEGRCALDWIHHVEKAMTESIGSINEILERLQERQKFSN